MTSAAPFFRPTVFERVQHDERTTWPDGFEPPERSEVIQDPISAMTLPDYLAWRAKAPR